MRKADLLLHHLREEIIASSAAILSGDDAHDWKFLSQELVSAAVILDAHLTATRDIPECWKPGGVFGATTRFEEIDGA